VFCRSPDEELAGKARLLAEPIRLMAAMTDEFPEEARELAEPETPTVAELACSFDTHWPSRLLGLCSGMNRR
jgi:hypothetical protein